MSKSNDREIRIIYIERWDKFFTTTIRDLHIPVVVSSFAIALSDIIPADGEFNFCRR